MTEEHQPQQVAAKEGADLEQAATPASDQADAIGAALAPESASKAESEPTESAASTETAKADAEQGDGETVATEKSAADKADAEKAEADKAAAEQDGAEQDGAEQAEGAENATPAADAEAEGAAAEGKESASAAAEGAGEESAEADDADGKKKGNVGLLVAGLAGIVVLVLAVVAAFVYPGFLAGPGKPDGQAAAVVKALSSKNAADLDKVTCHGHDGKPVSQIPAKALQLISAVKTTGPTTLSLDTEAIAPLNLTLSQQGKTQDVPVEAVLGVTNNSWCLKGISQAGGQ